MKNGVLLRTSWILALAGLVPSARATADDWPQLQHDAGHTGHTADPGPAGGKILWEYDLNRETVGKPGQPVVAAGKVYLGSNAGILRCFDAADGNVLWQYKAKSPIFHTAAVEQRRVFFADLAGYFCALDAESGKELFVFEGGLPGFSAAVVLGEGRVFLGRRDGLFYCLDQQTGKKVWCVDLGASIFMTAAYYDGLVYVGSEDMIFRALDAKTGKEVWKTPKLCGLGFFWYWPVVHRGRVVALTMEEPNVPGVFNAVDPQGYAKWEELKRSLKDARYVRHEQVPYVKENLAHDQQKIAQWLAIHPKYQTFYVFDAKTGKQPYFAPVVPAATNTNLMFPPIVLADGALGTFYSGTHLFHDSWHEFYGRFDVEIGRIVERTGGCTRDQTMAHSSGGKRVFFAGDALNHVLESTPHLKNVRTIRSFTQSGQGSMAIVGKRLYYVESDVLFCCGE
ncbi:MAG: PQQ-binding-like beta-propeller repeat protein [Thermoguttaceae bacterium]|jgi:outer membrane protein assembly factor BamB